MSNMRNFKIYADECTAIFVNAMRGFDGHLLTLQSGYSGMPLTLLIASHFSIGLDSWNRDDMWII